MLSILLSSRGSESSKRLAREDDLKKNRKEHMMIIPIRGWNGLNLTPWPCAIISVYPIFVLMVQKQAAISKKNQSKTEKIP